MMSHETNIDSIRALDKQIGEHERAVVKLKRTRNSLLNISKLPPEVLGKIFHCNVTLKGDFDGLGKESHNFLLVCHHWFEVASCTPDLWTFWGNSPKDWARWCHRSGIAPLDLVLSDSDKEDYEGNYLDGTTLCDVLGNRVAQDTIRCVHLIARDWYLDSLIALLTTDRGEPQSKSIESFILRNESFPPTTATDFFAHHRFPKLRRLELTNCTISSWDHLISQTSVLTTLELGIAWPSPTPTTPQLLSILSSNPNLQKVGLTGYAFPDDDGGESSVRVQLRHLRELRLEGCLRDVIMLLDNLDHPKNMDNLSLTLHDSDITDISQTVGPYLRDHFQRRDRPQNGPNLHISFGDRPGPWAGDAMGIHISAPEGGRIIAFFAITAVLRGTHHRTAIERAALDLITYAPLEEAVYFHTYSIPIVMEDVHTRFPNLRKLLFDAVPLRAVFPDPNLITGGEVLPSLEHISLERVVVDGGDWSPLVTFLARRVSSVNRLNTLTIDGSRYMCPEWMESIRDMVRQFEVDAEALKVDPQ